MNTESRQEPAPAGQREVRPLFERSSIQTLLRLAAILGVALGIETTILHLATDPMADVRAYYDAGARLNAGEPLYVQVANTDDPGFYRYPPLLAIAFRPLALLPYGIATAIWVGVLLLATWLTFRRLGLRKPVLLMAGWLALPIMWTLTIGQAQGLVTYFLAIGSPWAVAAAGHLKLFPFLAAVFWLGRRDVRSFAAFLGWCVGLALVQLVLEPNGTLAYLGFLSLEQVGDVANVSPYAISPWLWLVTVAALFVVAIRFASSRYGWLAAVALSVFATPRLLVYQLSSLLAGLGGPRQPESRNAEPPSASGGGSAEPAARRLDGMRSSESLTIVLPAYNEAQRIGPALDELFAYLITAHGLPHPIEVLVVDDGSSDGTAAMVEARPEAAGSLAGVSLRVLPVPHGGKGAAVRAGMLDAKGDLIVFADADMATPPDQLPLLVSALREHDVALGSRIQPDGSDMRATQPGYRRFLGKAFHVLASIWVVGPVKDTQCGFKGFRRDVARDLFALQQITSIVFDVELIYLARRRRYSLAVVPIRWNDVRGSRMRATAGMAARVAWDLFRIPLIHRRLNSRPSPGV